MLSLRAIRFGYDEADAWELRIPELTLGAIPLCGIIGANGSGKSTLLKLAAGLLAPKSGAVEFQGRALARQRRAELARHIGFLPQECPMLFDYTVEQVVAMGRHAHGASLELNATSDREAVERALGDVGLAAFRQRPLSSLSGGERRRVWLASALAQEPEILLLDEPTQALDLHQAATVMDILTRRAVLGLRVVVVMHDINLAALFCDRLLLLHAGEIIADGPPEQVLNPNNLTRAFGDKIEVLQHPISQKTLILAKK